MQNPITFISQVATVVLIAVGLRWLFSARGTPLPRLRDGTSIYGIRWQWRAVAIVGVAFGVLVSVWSWHDLHRPDRVMIAIAGVFAAMGLWLATGLVTTDRAGITKKNIWRTQHFSWTEVTEIRIHKSQGGAIELRSGSRKLVVDFRFVAFDHLVSEIVEQTHLKPMP